MLLLVLEQMPILGRTHTPLPAGTTHVHVMNNMRGNDMWDRLGAVYSAADAAIKLNSWTDGTDEACVAPMDVLYYNLEEDDVESIVGMMFEEDVADTRAYLQRELAAAHLERLHV